MINKRKNHDNYERALFRKTRKIRSMFINQHDFIDSAELSFTSEELASLVDHRQIIWVEIDGRRKYPAFQFDDEGRVMQTLAEHLPRLLADRSSWDVCFWLYQEQSVTLMNVEPDSLKGKSFREQLMVINDSEKLVKSYIGRPIDLLIQGESEDFLTFVEHFLNPYF